jgi:hypothetical protein
MCPLACSVGAIELRSVVIDIYPVFRHRSRHLDGAAAPMSGDTLLYDSGLLGHDKQEKHQNANSRSKVDEHCCGSVGLTRLRLCGAHIR